MTSGSSNGWPGVIKAPAQKVEHDALCHAKPTIDPRRCAECKQLAAVRADERERIAVAINADAEAVGNWDTAYDSGWRDGMQDAARITRTAVSHARERLVTRTAVLADLRDKVEALSTCTAVDALYYWELVPRADVLALLDGGSDA